MTHSRSSKDSKPSGARPPSPKAARRRAKKRPTLRDRLAKRLGELALDIPYAAQLARKLRANPDKIILADVVIDMMCMQAIQGNATVLRSLWERVEGTPAGPEEAADKGPRCIRTPLPVPPLPGAGR